MKKKKLVLSLLKEFILNPVVLLINGIITALGNFELILSHWPCLNNFVSNAIVNEPIKSALSFFSNYWGYLLLLVIIYEIFSGFYNKTKMYLGERISTSRIQVLPKEKPPVTFGDFYVYLDIINGENLNLHECFVSLDVLMYKTEKGWVDCRDKVIENTRKFAWPAFNKEAEKVVEKTARVNIAKMQGGGEVFFVMEDGDRPGLSLVGFNLYYIEISFNGKINSKQIEEIIIRGFIERESRITNYEDRKSVTNLHFTSGELPSLEKKQKNHLTKWVKG